MPVYNEEQYIFLLECAENNEISKWNKWRENHTNTKINLIGANFSRVHFEEANLSKAHLESANLWRAHLERTLRLLI